MNKLDIDRNIDMLANAKRKFSKKSSNKVIFNINEGGNIVAYIFNEEKGIAVASPITEYFEGSMYENIIFYPDTEFFIKRYAETYGIDDNSVSILNEDFIKFVLLSERINYYNFAYNDKFYYSSNHGFIYDTYQDAINDLYSDDIFCCKHLEGKNNFTKKL